MIAFISRRTLSTLLTLLLLATLTFILLHIVPGGPFDADQAWPPEIQANILRRYGLDQPLWTQYFRWVKDLARGDLGESFQYLGRPVSQMIIDALPISAALGAIALLLALAVGIPLGVFSAWKSNTTMDAAAVFLGVSGVSLPSYLIASLLISIFALRLGWLPPALWENWQSAILPIFTLAVRPIAVISRLTRASMIETLRSDFIRTAHSKGLPVQVVLFKHALRNSLIPVLATMGPLTANLVTGSFVVEVVFQIPGTGQHFVSAVLNRDYPLVMGLTLTYGAILLIAHSFIDVAMAAADPRIRLEALS